MNMGSLGEAATSSSCPLFAVLGSGFIPDPLYPV